MAGAALALARAVLLMAGSQPTQQQQKADVDPDGDSEEERRHADALRQLSRLTRGHEVVDAPPADADECYEVPLPTRRRLSDQEKATFERDGFVCCRGWFSAEETDLLRRTIEQDRTATGSFITVVDTEGRDTKLTEWHRFGDDTYSQFGRSASLVRAASELMGGSEPFLSHAKLLLKEPHSGGAWEWHQDFGSVGSTLIFHTHVHAARCNSSSLFEGPATHTGLTRVSRADTGTTKGSCNQIRLSTLS